MRWPHRDSHCPNVVATQEEIRQFPWLSTLYLNANNQTREGMEHLVPINIKFQDRRIIYKSLPHFWSEWYKLYMDADFPRIMIRFEDLLFYGKEVTESRLLAVLILFFSVQNLITFLLPTQSSVNVEEESRDRIVPMGVLFTFRKVPNWGLRLTETTRPICLGQSSNMGIWTTG